MLYFFHVVMNDTLTALQAGFRRKFPEGIHLPYRGLSPDEFKVFIQKHTKIDGPLMIIYLRHGRSAGNERDNVAKLGDDKAALKAYYDSFDDHDLPLVGVGREQAKSAGRYIAHLWHTGVIPGIDRTFCSPFTRTKETLKEAVIGIVEYCSEHNINPEKVIHGDVEVLALIGERYWHDFNKLPKEARELGYKERTENPYFWIPGTSGEPIQETYGRAREFIHKVHRPQFKGKVIFAPSHGEFISSSELPFFEMDPTSDEFKRSFNIGVPNCGIYAFSRAPISPKMNPKLARSTDGFKYYLKCAPYVLEGEEAAKFEDWSGDPEWHQKQNRRFNALSFPADIKFSSQSQTLAEELERADIGERTVRPRI